MTGRRLLRWFERALACGGVLFLVYHLGFEVLVITSDSMAPTLKGNSFRTGDRVLAEKITRRLRSPRRWEVYAYYNEDSILIAKRVVGLPGERVAIRGHSVLIDGVELLRPPDMAPVRYYPYGNLSKGVEVRCEGGYFMLGDDSIDSLDSRYSGCVTKDRFLGRAWRILEPSERRGWVK